MDAAVLQAVDRILSGDEGEFRKLSRERLGVLWAAASVVLPEGDELTAVLADALQAMRGKMSLVKAGASLDDLLCQQALQAARRRVASGTAPRHPLDWKPAEGLKEGETAGAWTPETLSRLFVQANLPPEARPAFNTLLESDPSFARRVFQVVAEKYGPLLHAAPAGTWEKVEAKLPPLAPSGSGVRETAPSGDGWKFLDRIFNFFEAPELQFRVLGIVLGAMALTALCLVVWRWTGDRPKAVAPQEVVEETYVGLEPDVAPTPEPTPTAAPRAAPAVHRAKKAAPGRPWIERADSASPPASGPAPPPVRASGPKEYVPGDASEFLSDIKVPKTPTPAGVLPEVPASLPAP
jgi:hypothetical protein